MNSYIHQSTNHKINQMQAIINNQAKYSSSIQLDNLSHPLDIQIIPPFNSENIRLNFHDFNTLDNFFDSNSQFKNRIVQYLIKMVEQVSSISFHYYSDDIMNEKQVKNYASKNIIENIKNLCNIISLKIKKEFNLPHGQEEILEDKFYHQVILDLQFNQKKKQIQNAKDMLLIGHSNEIMKRYLNQTSNIIKGTQRRSFNAEQIKCLQQFKKQYEKKRKNRKHNHHDKIENLITKINQFIIKQLKPIMNQIAEKYPIVSSSGVSTELMETIKSVDCRQDYKYDFLLLNMPNNQFKITNNKISTDQIIIQDIMKTINKILQLPHQKVNHNSQTFYESFQKFNKNLLWMATRKQLSKTIIKNDTQIVKYLIDGSTLSKNLKCGGIKQFTQQQSKKLNQFKEEKRFQIGIKLQKSVPIFENKQILNEIIKIKHSAVLRVLVKWIEDLMQIFKNSEKFIIDNSHTFKNHSNQLLSLTIQQRNILHQQIVFRWLQIKQQFEKQEKQNNEFVAELLKNPQSDQPTYSFEKSLKFSSQMNSYFIKKTTQRLVKLIKELLKLPQDAIKAYQQFIQRQCGRIERDILIEETMKKQKLGHLQTQHKQSVKKLKDINLVTNRLGDLLRAKFYCNEQQFMNILNMMYSLDAYCRTNKLPHFKLLRIKNKMKDDNNNVLINYMFQEKAQCQLQLYLNTYGSPHQKKKIKKFNQMNHYLYQLVRGILGVISQLTTIVNQNDPQSIRNNPSNFQLKKFYDGPKPKAQRNIISLQKDSKNKYWRCIYTNCNQFNVYGKNKLIKQEVRQQDRIIGYRYTCLHCFKRAHNCSNTIALSKLSFDAQSSWIREMLVSQKILQELSEDIFQRTDQYLQEIVFIIEPTERQIFAQFFILFYCPTNFCIVINSLQNEKMKAKKFKFTDFKQSKKDHFYFRVKSRINLFSFIMDRIKGNNRLFKNLKHQISLNNIRKVQKRSTINLNIGFLNNNLMNNNSQIILSQREGISVKQFASHIQQYSHHQIQVFQCSGLHFKELSIFERFSSLRILNLSHNKLQGVITINKFQRLQSLNLNNNTIVLIKIFHAQNLQKILLDNNQLEQFSYISLPKLKHLSLQSNAFDRSLELLQLPQLEYLNINYSNIKSLNIKDSSKLKTLLCKGTQPKQRINKQAGKIQTQRYQLMTMRIWFSKNVVLQNIQSLNKIIKIINDLSLDNQQIAKFRGNINIDSYIIFTKEMKNLATLYLYLRYIQNVQKEAEKKKLRTMIDTCLKNCISLKDLQLRFVDYGLYDVQPLDLSLLPNVKSLYFRNEGQSKLNRVKIGNAVQNLSLLGNAVQNIGLLAENLNKLDIVKIEKSNLKKLKIYYIENQFFDQHVYSQLETITIFNSFIKKKKYEFMQNQNLTQFKLHIEENQSRPIERPIERISFINGVNIKFIQFVANIQSCIISNCNRLQTALIKVYGKIQNLQISLNNAQYLRQLRVECSCIHILKIHLNSTRLRKLTLKTADPIDIKNVSNNPINCNLEYLEITNTVSQVMSKILKSNSTINTLVYYIISEEISIDFNQGLFWVDINMIIIQNQLNQLKDNEDKTKPINQFKITLSPPSYKDVIAIILPNFIYNVTINISNNIDSIIIRESFEQQDEFLIESFDLKTSQDQTKDIHVYFQLKNKARIEKYQQSKVKLYKGKYIIPHFMLEEQTVV